MYVAKGDVACLLVLNPGVKGFSMTGYSDKNIVAALCSFEVGILPGVDIRCDDSINYLTNFIRGRSYRKDLVDFKVFS